MCLGTLRIVLEANVTSRHLLDQQQMVRSCVLCAIDHTLPLATQVGVVMQEAREYLQQQQRLAESGRAPAALAMVRGTFARALLARRSRVNGDDGAPVFSVVNDVVLELSMRTGYACLLQFVAPREYVWFVFVICVMRVIV